MEPPSTCFVRLRITFSIIGIIVGLSVLLIFGLHFQNWNTALGGLLSGIGAAISLWVHICYVRGTWEICAYQLKAYMLTGCFIQLIGVCGIVTYLALAITLKQGLIIYGPGYYLAVIWSAMTLKWGFLLFYYSRSYYRLYTDSYFILPEKNTAPKYTSGT